jgi:acetate kinase
MNVAGRWGQLRRQFRDVPLYAMFDTAFHATIPPEARYYPIPYELSQKHDIRRYGFHGISHRYLMKRYAAITNESSDKLNLVTMHLERLFGNSHRRGNVG